MVVVIIIDHDITIQNFIGIMFFNGEAMFRVKRSVCEPSGGSAAHARHNILCRPRPT